ncbi:hypothetical protein Hanom_Chr06g00538901 [Helianthus anomalus]
MRRTTVPIAQVRLFTECSQRCRTILDSSLGPDCFIDDEEDQVSSLPLSWFGPELLSFFRYAEVFSDDMEIDPATADEKFVPEWDVRNKDSVMDDLIARTFLFNISTPLDHARSRKMKNQDLGAAVLSNQAQSNVYVTELYGRWVEAESMRENLEKETLSLKRKIQRTPDAEKKLSQLSQDLQTQKEKVKSLTIRISLLKLLLPPPWKNGTKFQRSCEVLPNLQGERMRSTRKS